MAIYYIGTTGDDANDGTRDSPFATAAAVTDRLEPGDTVFFLAGTYTNPTYGALDADGNRDIWKANTDTIVKLNGVHGAEGQPITFAPEPGAAVTLKYDGNSAFVIRDSSHIKVEGFDIEGPATSVTKEDALAAQWTYRIATSEDAQGNPVYEYFERDPSEVLDTKIKDTIAEYAALGIDQSGSGKPLMWNAAAISTPKGSHHIEITGNTIHDSAAHAVSAHGGNDYMTVTDNVIYNNTRYTTNGTHAISFKALNSIDDEDGVKIRVEGNHLYDNYNSLISWVTSKTFVTSHIDEGKSIHVQNSTGDIDPETGRIWDHGTILIANNTIERSGNAAVTANSVRGMVIARNTVTDAGYVNRIIDGDTDPDSDWFGFFSAQGLPEDYRVVAGGLRLAGATELTVARNLFSISDDRLFTVDASAVTTAANTTAIGNLYDGGRGLRLRASETDLGDLRDGFTATDADGLAGAASEGAVLVGTGNAESLYGGAGADVLVGQAGNDMLSGEAGGDILIGGAGSDTASYDDSATYVWADLQYASLNRGDHALGDIYDDIEHLIGTAQADTLRGDGGDNSLTGGDGNDILVGRDGNDTMMGGAGDDMLLGGEGADVYIGGEGIDQANYFYNDSGIRADFIATHLNTGAATGDTYFGMENLRGTRSEDDLRGNAADNRIDGFDGNDILFGRAGNDDLRGGAGNDFIGGGTGDDLLVGHAGRDTFNFGDIGAGVDTILDFRSGTDRLRLDADVFTAIGSRYLDPNSFVDGPAALDRDDYIIHDSGMLFYDADGSGAAAAVQFAVLANDGPIGAGDFLIV